LRDAHVQNFDTLHDLQLAIRHPGRHCSKESDSSRRDKLYSQRIARQLTRRGGICARSRGQTHSKRWMGYVMSTCRPSKPINTFRAANIYTTRSQIPHNHSFSH